MRVLGIGTDGIQTRNLSHRKQAPYWINLTYTMSKLKMIIVETTFSCKFEKWFDEKKYLEENCV